jgi:thiosulfate/3-mercaptopyruvate sulfurtransferase
MASQVIAVSELAAALRADPHGTTLLDVRWALGRPDGREEYLAGHLPGASYVDLETELAGPRGDGSGGRHPLPEPARFAAAMTARGVRRDRPVVVYDAVGGTSAARAWWLLRDHGHHDVRLLDGGWQAWTAAGLPVETGETSAVGGGHRAAGTFDPAPGHLPVLDADGVAELAMAGAGAVVLDARAPERFRGEREPVDPVAGHVPGAVNLPATELLSADAGLPTLRPWPELAAVLRDAGARPAAPAASYCGSGVTASLLVLVLAELGVEAALYPGSWSAWVADPGRPVATGDA